MAGRERPEFSARHLLSASLTAQAARPRLDAQHQPIEAGRELRLPISPHVSPYLPISPHISPQAGRELRLLLIAAAACLVEMARTGWGLWVNIFGDDEFTMMQYSMSSTDPRVELSREFFGALIALAAVGLLWWERGRFATDSKAPAAQSD